VTCCTKNTGNVRKCSHDQNRWKLNASCSTNPVGPSGAVHQVTIDNYLPGTTLFNTRATASILNGIQPQVAIEFDDNGVGTANPPARPMGDITGQSNLETFPIRRRPAGDRSPRSIETHIVWDVSAASQLQPGIPVQARHRCCTYTVSMT
jgi:hypothetical protein